MIRIMDNTLTGIDGLLPSKEDLHTFCKLLILAGVDMIELSLEAFGIMEVLPEEGRYVLHIDYADQITEYPGFYRYTCHHDGDVEKLINEVQVNDVREVIKLRTFNHCKEMRITGMDDLMCQSFEKTMKEMKRTLPNSKINFCPENTYSCASALAVQWLLNGGSDVTTSFAGFKNNGATEEVIMALRLAIRHKPNRDLTVLPQLTALFEKITNRQISNKKPVIGRNIFKVEAGIHADGIKKNPATYEAYEPGCVGGKSEIVIGKHSGIKAVKCKMEELKFKIPEEAVIETILELVKRNCTNERKSLSDEEFKRLVLEVTAGERK